MTQKAKGPGLTDIRADAWFKLAVLGLLLAGVYYSTLTWLVSMDWSRDDYSHSFLIPLVVLYLIWEKKDPLLSRANQPSWTGVIPFVLGFVFFWLGELAGEFFSLYVSFWLTVVGLCWMILGGRKTWDIGFALFIMLSMFPLPHFLYNKVSVTLKLISSQLGVSMMQFYGMSAYREGNVIDLGFTQLQVVDACSGLRFLIPLIVLSLLLAYFFKAHFWKRAVLVISSIPLSIVTNSLRIALTGILYEIWGAEVAEGFFHGFSGWFIFMFSLVVLLVEMWILGKLPPRRLATAHGPDTSADQADEDEREAPEAETPAPAASGFLRPSQFLFGAVVLILTLVISQGVEFREKVPVVNPLGGFPLQIGQWHGSRQSLEQNIIDTLDLNDYVVINYYNTDRRLVNFYTAYYESQRKGESIHSPATCLPGSGWLFQEAGGTVFDAPTAPGGKLKVNRAVMQKGENKQISYYWFPQRGRILTNAYQLKWYVFWDSLTMQRTDGALVRVITPIYPDEDLEKAEARLQDFARDINPVLNEYLPGRDLD